MNIQSNVNQLISVAGLLATQSPAYKTAIEKQGKLRSLGKQEKVLNEQLKTLNEAKQGGFDRERIGEELQSIAQQRFEIDPSKKTLESLRAVTPIKGEPWPADPEEIALERFQEYEREQEVEDYFNMYKEASEKAKQATQVKQEEKRNGRRKFADYLAGEEVRFAGAHGQAWGNVGDLSKIQQKEIAKTYSKAERKKIMDKGDLKNE